VYLKRRFHGADPVWSGPHSFLGSIYYYSFPAHMVMLAVLLVIALQMGKLRVREQIGLREELLRSSLSSLMLVGGMGPLVSLAARDAHRWLGAADKKLCTNHGEE
jgi:hypothetical protein